jgi:uncharacterized protein YndB with AHSA1/START domain
VNAASQRGIGTAFLVAAFLLSPILAQAEVVDSSSTGFTVRTTLTINAHPDDVYRKFIRNIAEWWNPEHTFSGDSHNLSIEEKAAGCFCEKLANGGSVRHLEVVYLAPGKAVTLSGALGPLQSLAATGSMSILFSPSEGGTKLTVNYAVTGYLPGGMNTWAAPVDAVIAEQFTRLKNYVLNGAASTK